MNLKKMIKNKILMMFIILVITIGAFAVGLDLCSLPIANIHGSVKKADIQSKIMEISLGNLNSGESFRIVKNSYNALSINNVTKVKIDIEVQNFNTTEGSAFKSINITIIIGDHHQNGTWDEYINGTINPLQSENLSAVLPGNHEYDIKIVIEGTTGYPSDNVSVDFSIFIAVESP